MSTKPTSVNRLPVLLGITTKSLSISVERSPKFYELSTSLVLWIRIHCMRSMYILVRTSEYTAHPLHNMYWIHTETHKSCRFHSFSRRLPFCFAIYKKCRAAAGKSSIQSARTTLCTPFIGTSLPIADNVLFIYSYYRLGSDSRIVNYSRRI